MRGNPGLTRERNREVRLLGEGRTRGKYVRSVAELASMWSALARVRLGAPVVRFIPALVVILVVLLVLVICGCAVWLLFRRGSDETNVYRDDASVKYREEFSRLLLDCPDIDRTYIHAGSFRLKCDEIFDRAFRVDPTREELSFHDTEDLIRSEWKIRRGIFRDDIKGFIRAFANPNSQKVARLEFIDMMKYLELFDREAKRNDARYGEQDPVVAPSCSMPTGDKRGRVLFGVGVRMDH